MVGGGRGRTRAALAGVAVALAALAALARPVPAHDPPPPTPPPAMDFVPPAPGSYRLHAIMRAPEGRVLDADGRPAPLSRFTRGKITLLGFVYTSCTDAYGCPLTYGVFHAVRERVQRTPALRDRVRLVTLSFDPATDTPAVMRRYAAAVDPRGVEWAFLTTRSPRELRPLLDGFGQDVRIVAADGDAGAGSRLGHMLKVFLLDPRGVVREIYSTSYLYPELVLNDVETLRMESEASAR
ncbi:MAG TPA: SCO family protein [Methylomirabilota bacterium]|nr:SCO family protein [Methylomirabilota bacterium]